ncbi:tripartite motif-containing protein 2-like isoform X2 [Mercenaria mercenaria]|nr:tripartite motif-containing protein 2-like isoform X2 [Mercenaria mercenaria]
MDPMSVKRNPGRRVSFGPDCEPAMPGKISRHYSIAEDNTALNIESDADNDFSKMQKSKSDQEFCLIPTVIIENDKSHDNATFKSDEVSHNDCFVSAFGKKGKNIGEYEDAKNVTCLSRGRILITDLVNSRLQICSGISRTITVFSPQEINLPWATTVTKDNYIAVSLCKDRCVKVLNMDGDVMNSFGEDYFVRPTGLATDKKGNFIVCDFSTDKVLMFDSEGKFICYLGNSDNEEECFSKPSYVCVSITGDIIVSDSGHHKIKIFDSQGKFIRSVGCFGRGKKQFKSPYGVTTNKCGDIFVADHYNNRISMFTRDGVFVRHLVTSEHGLVHPQGLTISEDLHLYITHGHLKACEILVFKLTNDIDYTNSDIISYV